MERSLPSTIELTHCEITTLAKIESHMLYRLSHTGTGRIQISGNFPIIQLDWWEQSLLLNLLGRDYSRPSSLVRWQPNHSALNLGCAPWSWRRLPLASGPVQVLETSKRPDRETSHFNWYETLSFFFLSQWHWPGKMTPLIGVKGDNLCLSACWIRHPKLLSVHIHSATLVEVVCDRMGFVPCLWWSSLSLGLQMSRELVQDMIWSGVRELTVKKEF